MTNFSYHRTRATQTFRREDKQLARDLIWELEATALKKNGNIKIELKKNKETKGYKVIVKIPLDQERAKQLLKDPENWSWDDERWGPLL